MRQSHALPVVLFAVAAVVLGLGVIVLPAVVLPLALEGLILLGVTVALLNREPDPDTRRWLLWLVAGALGVRLLLIFVVHFVISPYVFAPDARTYEYFGGVIRDYWSGLRPTVGSIAGSWQVAYHYINGAAIELFGDDASLGPVVLNTFASVWTALLTFHLGRKIRNEATGKVLAVLVAFFPSLVLWSVLNIRDSITTFLVVMAALLVVRAREKASTRNGLLALGTLVVLSTFRDYMGLLTGAGLALGLVAALRPGKVFRTLATGVVVVVGLVLVAETSGVLERFPVERSLDVITQLREDMTRGAGSAFAGEAAFEGPADAISFLPVGAVYFLFAPFPWAISSPLQMAALPETLLWYALIPVTLLGLTTVWRERRPGALPLLSVLLVIISAYSLVEGNVGTAYRHRAQVMPLVFFFTAVGLERLWRRWQANRRRRMSFRSGSPPIGHDLPARRRRRNP